MGSTANWSGTPAKRKKKKKKRRTNKSLHDHINPWKRQYSGCTSIYLQFCKCFMSCNLIEMLQTPVNSVSWHSDLATWYTYHQGAAAALVTRTPCLVCWMGSGQYQRSLKYIILHHVSISNQDNVVVFLGEIDILWYFMSISHKLGIFWWNFHELYVGLC